MIRDLMPQPTELWCLVTDPNRTRGRVGRVVGWVLDDIDDGPTLVPIVARNGAPHAGVVGGEDLVELYDRRVEADNRLRELTDPEAHQARMDAFAEMRVRPVTPRVF